MTDKPNRPGRPSLVAGEQSTPVHVKVSNSDYDKAYKLASQNRVSVPEIFRRGFHRLLSEESDDDQ
jgi:hypothetical protein